MRFKPRRIRPFLDRVRNFSVGQGSTFDPSKLPGFFCCPIVSLMLADSKIWQDSVRTTLATANNDPVRAFQCTFSGTIFTSPGGTLKIYGPYSWIQTNGAGDVFTATSIPTVSAGMTLAMRLQRNDLDGSSCSRAVVLLASNGQVISTFMPSTGEYWIRLANTPSSVNSIGIDSGVSITAYEESSTCSSLILIDGPFPGPRIQEGQVGGLFKITGSSGLGFSFTALEI